MLYQTRFERATQVLRCHHLALKRDEKRFGSLNKALLVSEPIKKGLSSRPVLATRVAAIVLDLMLVCP
jgi:hypothetical protein